MGGTSLYGYFQHVVFSPTPLEKIMRNLVQIPKLYPTRSVIWNKNILLDNDK